MAHGSLQTRLQQSVIGLNSRAIGGNGRTQELLDVLQRIYLSHIVADDNTVPCVCCIFPDPAGKIEGRHIGLEHAKSTIDSTLSRRDQTSPGGIYATSGSGHENENRRYSQVNKPLPPLMSTLISSGFPNPYCFRPL